MGTENKCSVPRCRKERYITYLTFGVCEHHWDTLSREDLRRLLDGQKAKKWVTKLLEENEDELD